MLSDSVSAKVVAGIFAGLSCLISLYQIIGHLRFYHEPVFQRYIVRIIFMVPLYAVASFLSLIFSDQHVYFDTIRDMYEAWILYNFLSLCLAYIGGPAEVVMKCEGRYLEPSWLCCTCCLPKSPINVKFLRRCKQGVLQFVLAKPVLAVLTLWLYNVRDGEGTRRYNEGDWSAGNGYLWIQIMYNICYTLALYALIVFYQGTEILLDPFKPLLKFILIKSVVFLTFWQGLVISVLASMDYLDSPESAKDLQNFLICIEMLFAAILLLFAFPFEDYKVPGVHPQFGTDIVRHAISIRDVVKDTYYQFAPHYHDYVLYSDDATSKPVRKTVRTKTWVKMGEETTRYHDHANLLVSSESVAVDVEPKEVEMTAKEEEEKPRQGNDDSDVKI